MVLIDPVPQVFSFLRDSDDEPYLNLALAAAATYLVTWDNDLLELMGENPDGAAFRGRFPGLRVLTPVAFLREVASPRAAPAEGQGPSEAAPSAFTTAPGGGAGVSEAAGATSTIQAAPDSRDPLAGPAARRRIPAIRVTPPAQRGVCGPPEIGDALLK